MSEQVVRLVYPAALLSVPVINQLIRKFDITLNILKAQIDAENRWLEIQLSGDPFVISEAINWLQEQGIHVQPPEK